MKNDIVKLNNLRDPVNLYGSKSWIVNAVAKEDLSEYLTKKEIEKLTDSNMSYIANKMSDRIQETYWIALEYAVELLKKRINQ